MQPSVPSHFIPTPFLTGILPLPAPSTLPIRTPVPLATSPIMPTQPPTGTVPLEVPLGVGSTPSNSSQATAHVVSQQTLLRHPVTGQIMLPQQRVDATTTDADIGMY